VFHLELRQRPHVSRAFNLGERELRDRFLLPLASGRPLVYADREWEPRKTKVTVYEAPELRPDEIGMGRGWANVTRSGSDVTERLLAELRSGPDRPPALGPLKERMLDHLADGPLALADAVGMADDLLDGHRASERLAVAERAVWELLHEGALELLADRDSPPVGRDAWEPLLLSWTAWSSEAPVFVRAAAQLTDLDAPGRE
jgi:hypothetical protein